MIGTALIVAGLYFIGSNKNMFGSTIRVSASFYNVNGLMPGNNVRFGGINVGTVDRVEIITDSTIEVVMVIKEKSRQFIKKNAIVSIGTDGLMGNKLVNINAIREPAALIADGDTLQTLHPIETDEMVRTLNRTNEDVAVIAKNLRVMTSQINNRNNLWSILMDTLAAKNVKEAIVNIRLTSKNTATITGDLSEIIENIKSGKGTVGALLTDTSLLVGLRHTLINIEVVSDTLAHITGDLRSVSQKLKNGEGAIGAILMDTAFAYNLRKSMDNIKNGSGGFNDNMEALKHNFLLRKYFKKQEKQAKKK